MTQRTVIDQSKSKTVEMKCPVKDFLSGILW